MNEKQQNKEYLTNAADFCDLTTMLDYQIAIQITVNYNV